MPLADALIHISELADITVAEPLQTVRPQDEIKAKILRIDVDSGDTNDSGDGIDAPPAAPPERENVRSSRRWWPPAIPFP